MFCLKEHLGDSICLPSIQSQQSLTSLVPNLAFAPPPTPWQMLLPYPGIAVRQRLELCSAWASGGRQLLALVQGKACIGRPLSAEERALCRWWRFIDFHLAQLYHSGAPAAGCQCDNIPCSGARGGCSEQFISWMIHRAPASRPIPAFPQPPPPPLHVISRNSKASDFEEVEVRGPNY